MQIEGNSSKISRKEFPKTPKKEDKNDIKNIIIPQIKISENSKNICKKKKIVLNTLD